MLQTTGSQNRLESQVLRGNARRPAKSSFGHKCVRLLTDPDFTVRAVRYALGLPVPLATEDRRVLEQTIFPYYLSLPSIHSVLFVGCDWYTRHYESGFFQAHNFWTMDPAPQAQKNGARQHLVKPLERLEEYFPPGYFDLIVCNGVYGYGLDTREQCEQAFDQCHSRLKHSGHFVLGWVDMPERTPVPLETLASLQRFKKFPFPPFGSWRHVTDTPYRHTYDFYRK